MYGRRACDNNIFHLIVFSVNLSIQRF